MLGGATLFGAAVTAFYMTRVFVLTFTGTKRWDENAHPHESSFLMWLPMVILAIGSVTSGFLLSSGSALVNWLEPVVNESHEHHEHELLPPIVVSSMALTFVAIGVALAILKYRTVPTEAPEKVTIFTKAARKDLYQDSFNEAVFMRPGQRLTSALVNTDNKVVDGLVKLVGWLVQTIASSTRSIQNGYVRSYALIMVLGVIALLVSIWMVTL